MSNALLILTLLTVPVLLYPLQTYRKGLVNGLFIALTFFCSAVPLLTLVPLGVSVCLFLTAKKKNREAAPAFYVKSAAVPKLTVFLLSMAIFCGFGDIFYSYGLYLSLPPEILKAGIKLTLPALALGPVLAGIWCDRKGAFSACIALGLFTELSILLTGGGGQSQALYLLGHTLAAMCISGFFVVMPMVCRSFFGADSFHRFYLPLAANAGLFWLGTKYLCRTKWAALGNPGELLLSLLFLVLAAVFFAVLAWNRRLTLVRPPKKAAEKTGS